MSNDTSVFPAVLLENAVTRPQPGDSTCRALALDVLRIEDGLITGIVTFSPDTFPLFGLPMLMDPAPKMNVRH
jgi:hypothetical protein